MITRPLLAGKVDLKKLTYPVYATPKLDGIRALKIEGSLVSRSFKLIPNVNVRELFNFLPDGIDGELMLRGIDDFNEVQSVVMRREADPGGVYFSAFDYVKEYTDTPYLQRIEDLKKYRKSLSSQRRKLVKGLYPIEIWDEKSLLEFESSCVDDGFEGIMIRKDNGPYKCGRSTTKEQILLKLKRFHDAEATVIGFEERMHNENKLEKDKFGLAKRSHKKANLSGTNTLGALLVRTEQGIEFRLGTGFDEDDRKELWQRQNGIRGRQVTYKFQELSKDGVPRFPVFKGFREEG